MANVDKTFVLELTEDEVHALMAVLGKVISGGPASNVYDALSEALWGTEDYLYEAQIKDRDGRGPAIEVWRA